MNKPFLLFALTLVLVTASCQLEPASASAFAPAGEPAYAVDFTDAPDWCQLYSESYGDFFCEAGEFQLVNHRGGLMAGMADSQANFRDFMLEAKMHSVDGAGSYGIEFRINPQTSASYIFRVTPYGGFQFMLWRQATKGNELLPWTPSAAIRKGTALNALQVIAKGNHFTLFANGQELAALDDNALPEGVVGVVAMEAGHAAVSSLKVWKLP